MPIQDTDKKLEEFTDTIITEAIEEAHKITLELKSKQDALIKESENSIAAEAERYRNSSIAEISAAEERRISAKRNADKHALLEYRESCAVDIYKRVQSKIYAFTASDAYLLHLKKLLKEAIESLGSGISVIVYLRAEDMRFGEELICCVTGVSIAISQGDFSLGGLRVFCPSKGQRIDMSFDTALNDMVGHFSELAGLKMGQ